jgi:[ribosomal protein S5]-alanine N-acetyltransferase
MATVLETTRLVLREMTYGDLDFVAGMLADEAVMRYYPGPMSRSLSEGWLIRQFDRYESHGYGLWLALGKDTGEPVGQVGLTPPRGIAGADETELGYLIHRPFWRRGFAAEAASACRDYAFDVLGRPRMICCIRPVNAPSLGVARKIGLVEEEGTRPEILGFEHLVFSQERSGRFGVY